MSQARINRIGQASGMSLLEVMIAVLVFSVGIIGVAALMLTSMRNNDATLARTQSTMLANEMYEKMLANLPGATAGNYTIAMASALPVSTSINCADASADCSTADLATWDMVQWSTRVRQVLVNPDAAIAVNTSVDPMIIQISVRFVALMETAGVTTETFTFRAR